MNFSKLVKPNQVVFLEVSTKNEALRRVSEVLAETPEVEDLEILYEAMLKRESILSTGVGLGLAVPHTKMDSIREFVVAIGVLRTPVEYDSIDGKPVQIIVMVGAHDQRQEEYLRLLAQVMEILRMKENRQRILEAQTPETVVEVFRGVQAPPPEKTPST